MKQGMTLEWLTLPDANELLAFIGGLQYPGDGHDCLGLSGVGLTGLTAVAHPVSQHFRYTQNN
jgi:hypothetical protein